MGNTMTLVLYVQSCGFMFVLLNPRQLSLFMHNFTKHCIRATN